MPEDPANTRRSSRGWKERQAQRQEKEFQKTPGGERIAKLEATTTTQGLKIDKIQSTLDNLQGAGGIEVKLPIISLDPRQAGAGNQPDPEVPPMEKFYGVKAGSFAAWLIPAQETTV